MTPHPPPPTVVSVRRMSLMVLLVVIGCMAAIDALANSESLVRWTHSRWVEKWKGSNHCPPHWPFLGSTDRLFLDELPNADFSRGGVFFFGSSNLETSLLTWSLPPEQRELVQCYSVPGSSHTDHDNFIRYLLEHKDWLAAGGDKTMAVLGVFYGSSKSDSWFANAFEHGLYTYSAEDGLHPTGASWLYRFLRTERVRCRLFLLTCQLVLHLTSDFTFDVDLAPQPWTRAYPESIFKRRWTDRMGPDWEENMVVELRALGESLDLLKANHVRTEVVLLPVGSWPRELPFHEPFVKQVKTLTEEKSVPLLDLSELLRDDEFVDQIHMNYAGAQKSHAAMMEIALDHLRRTGAVK